MFFDGYDYQGNSFVQIYHCYSASLVSKPLLESGDKIIMPPSALDRLASMLIDYPMVFELSNDAKNQVSHCGVLEFVSEEGMIYMPSWMMENLHLKEGNIVRVKNVTLPKGTYMKLQPHSKDFLDTSNPKAILEIALRNFTCMTTGDSIMVEYNKKKYYINIVETMPSTAVCIVETDCEADFAPPLDYKEAEQAQASVPAGQEAVQAQEALTEANDEHRRFTPFTGAGRRLDGKPSKEGDVPVAMHSAKRSTPSSAPSNSRQTKGKLVFGASSNNISREHKASRDVKEKHEKKEELKFQAFSGKKYTLTPSADQ